MIIAHAETVLRHFLSDDQYTLKHCRRVAYYSWALCKGIGLNSYNQSLVTAAALLHDVGKHWVPRQIIAKPARLNDTEFSLIRLHSSFSADALSSYQEFAPVLGLVRHHHERVDGRGYPAGLRGKEIPPAARIIAVADSFDAMTVDRPYHARRTAAEALDELTACAGTQFDELLVEKFNAILKRYLERVRTPKRDYRDRPDNARLLLAIARDVSRR